MNRAKSAALLIICVFFMNLPSALAQTRTRAKTSSGRTEAFTTLWADKRVQADGLLSDWPDSLRSYNEAARLFYAIANDNENLYIALKSDTREGLNKILMGGISFSATADPKTKEKPTVTFPVLDRASQGRRTDERPDEQDIQNQVLSRIKDIKVSGFREIIDGGISLQNTYGIKAAAAFDKENNLVQELIIPLHLLNLKTEKQEQVVYQIRINGLVRPGAPTVQRPMNQRPMPNGMYGRPFPQNNQLSKALSPTEFNLRSTLATGSN